MKRITTLLLLVFCAFTGSLYAQISQGGIPLSFQLKSGISQNIDNVFVNPPDMNTIRAEDELNEKNGEMYMVARLIDVDFSMDNSGSWDYLPDGTKIWRLSITSEDAKALSIHYSEFYLPEGSQLFLYNTNKKQVIGAFTSQNNPRENRRFSTEIIEGETTTLEYIQPAGIEGEPVINIFKVSYIYRGVNGLIGRYKSTKATGWGSSQACEVNINCPEGNNWQDEKRGVAEIYVIDGMSAGFCTGTLINNTNEDGTPYFLSADHCGGTSTDMDMWEFYFNYEASSCTTPGTEPSYNTIVGSTFRARGPQTGGSDFLLLELDEVPPASYGVYYNGWDISTTGASSAIGIHHPAGDIKKISKGGSLTTGTYSGCLANAHWQVVWQATATDHGVTEGGSSGSPIFNETTKKVVGTLTGGGASCTAQTAPDFYGKMDVHWETNGSTNADKLQPWLDPSNSASSLDGWDPNATASDLDAMFGVSESVISQGTCINFQDQSTGGPTGWSWSFPGAETTTSTQQNPVSICYNTPGVYNVILEITDGTDSDTYTCTDCVTVLDPGTDPICAFKANTTVVPVGGVVTFTDTSVNGPYVTWAWDFEGGLPGTSEVENPSPVAYLEVGTYDVELRVEHENGNQYICTKENYIKVVPEATEPPEADFIANYTVIQPGESVDFLDLSGNAPYQWEWLFEGGFPASSTEQNPTNITYGTEGEYQVRLIASNSEGNDTIVKEAYIIVSEDDPCLVNGDIPIAAYTATNRLLSAGDRTYFQDLSTNYPGNWNWYFEGGLPLTSTEASPMSGVEYNTPGIYNVTLSVSNSCGVDLLTKDDYIYVFSGTVYQYCDTISNVRGGEIPAKMNTPGTWGFIAGQNGERIRYYADKFDDYTFSQIEGLIVPVNNSVYGAYDSYVTFYVWDGSTEYPDSILAQKKVYIRNMPENFNSVVEFDSPVLVDGPFFVGFKLNYPDENGDGVSDDYFVVSVAGNRGPVESQNTMYVNKTSTWYSSVEYFNIATSLAIKPVACLVDISEFDIKNQVYTYPNPTSDYLTVELGEQYFDEDVEISIFDLTGRQLSVDVLRYSNAEYRVDFTNQVSGIYFIHVRVGDETMSKKISVVK